MAMGAAAAIVMGVTLVLVLALVLVLLADLYCTLFLPPPPNRAPTPLHPPHHQVSPSGSPSPSLCSFYHQGVLPAASRSTFLFPNHYPNSPISQSPPSSSTHDHLVYICNPIYDAVIGINSKPKVDTPFETPDTSPSQRLEEEEEEESTPQLSPMKKLPAEGASVSLRSINYLVTSYSSSSDSQRNSPSCSSW